MPPKLGAAPKAGTAAGEPPNTGGLPKPVGFWKELGDPNPDCATEPPPPALKAPAV